VAGPVELETHIGLSRARDGLSPLVDSVISGNLRVIQRPRDSGVALVRAEELEKVLSRVYAFNPEVYFGEDNVAVWLPELAIGGEGDDLAGAQEALLDAVLNYVATWEEELRRVPNHAARYGWVYRILLAERRDAIRDLLFGEREASNLRTAPSFL
jgi:hypothetical protein